MNFPPADMALPGNYFFLVYIQILHSNDKITGGDGTVRPGRNLNGNRPCHTRPSAAFGY
jgi:hypothetical protein